MVIIGLGDSIFICRPAAGVFLAAHLAAVSAASRQTDVACRVHTINTNVHPNIYDFTVAFDSIHYSIQLKE
jgi:hypothetical protein